MPHPIDVFLRPPAVDDFARAVVFLEQAHDSEVDRLQGHIRLLQTSLIAAGRNSTTNSPAAHPCNPAVRKASTKSTESDACRSASPRFSSRSIPTIREASNEESDSPSSFSNGSWPNRKTNDMNDSIASAESKQLAVIDAAQQREGSKSTCSASGATTVHYHPAINVQNSETVSTLVGKPLRSNGVSESVDTVHVRSSWDEDQKKKMAARMRPQNSRVGSADELKPTDRIKDFVESFYFETFFALAILSNSVFLGISADVRAKHPPDAESLPFTAFEYGYTILFSVELILRLVADGIWAYCDKGKCGWYVLDTFIVVTSLLEMIVDVVHSGDTHNSRFRVIRVIRVVRIIKVLRVARVVRFIRALRVLVLSILHTLRSVMWAFVLLVAIIYIFSLIFLQYVSEYIHSKDSISSSLRLFWGTLPRSMFTLYKSISSGISWHEVIEPLHDVSSMLVGLFIVFISFTSFAVLNVITGVFCEAAIESTRLDNEMVVQQHLAEKDQFTSAIYDLFGVSGANDDEILLSYGEFEQRLADPRTKAHLAAIELDISDAWELFKLLDTDNSALVDVEEFVCGCLRLKGFAKAIDVAKLTYESKTRAKRLTKQIVSIDKKLGIISKQLSNAKSHDRNSV